MLEEATKELDALLRSIDEHIATAKTDESMAQARLRKAEQAIKELSEKRAQIRKALEVLRAVDGPAQITP